jgi:hypothetical protein
MSVKELANAPGIWVYVISALLVVTVTIGVVLIIRYIQRHCGSINRRTREGYARLGSYEGTMADTNIGVGQQEVDICQDIPQMPPSRYHPR